MSGLVSIDPWRRTADSNWSLGLLYFDYSLTVGSEINLFWGSARWSAASVLFVVNRYLGLLGIIPVMFEYFGSYSPEVRIYLRPC